MKNEDLNFLAMVGTDTKNGNGNTNGNGSIKKEENGGSNGSSNSSNSNTCNTTEAETKKKKYLTLSFVTFLLFIFAANRISLVSFCHFDEAKQSYIIRTNSNPDQLLLLPSSSSSPSSRNTDSNSNNDKDNDKQLSQTLCQSSHFVLDHMALLFHPVVDYNIIVPKSILHPPPLEIGMAPQSATQSALSAQSSTSTSTAVEMIPTNKQQQQRQYDQTSIEPKSTQQQQQRQLIKNPIRIIVKLFHSFFQSVTNLFRKRKRGTNQKQQQQQQKQIASDSDTVSDVDVGDNTESNSDSSSTTTTSDTTDSNAKDDEDDWTFAVSVPMELHLSSEQRNVLEKTGLNFLQQLDTQSNDNDNNNGTDNDNSNSNGYNKLQNMFWGGKSTTDHERFASFPWWFPPGSDIHGNDNDNDESESSGFRTLSSYLKIMKWPEDLVTKYPFSHLCTDGCPTDFALAHTLEFREKYRPWSMTPAAYTENEKGFLYVRGYSPTRYHPNNEKGGSTVLWYKPGIQKISNQRHEEHFRVVIHGIETCIADALRRSDGKVGKCNIVLDATGFGLSYIPSMTATKKLLSMLQDHFPDRMGVFVICNMAKAAQVFLKMIMPFLPIEVRRKIHLLPSNEKERLNMMKSLVEKEYIPTWLGGQDTYTFDADEYYKTGKYKSDFISNEEGVEYITTMPYHA